MNKQEFLRRLESGLAGVAPDERVAAVQYYTEYFDDAGVDNEHNVLEELGDPDTLAADIKAVSELVEEAPGNTTDTAPAALEAEEITLVIDPIQPADAPAAPAAPTAAEVAAAPAAADVRAAPTDSVPPQYRFPGGYVPPRYGVQPQGQPYYGQQNQPYTNAGQNPGTPPPAYPGQYTQRPASGGAASVVKVIFTIILVMLFPAFIGIAIAALVILLIPFIIGAAFVAAAVGTFVVALYLMGASFASGLFLLGLSLLFLTGGLALGWAGIKVFIKGIPAFARGTATVFRSIYGGKGRA